MKIPNHSDLKRTARQALDACAGQKQIAVFYTAVLVGFSLLLTAADFVLSEMIAGTGGLGNLGTQAILSTLQSMLPIVQSLVLLGWNTGYFMTVLKITRGQYAYIGPADGGVKEGDTLTLGDRAYLVRRAEFYYFGNQAIYQWGLCVEKGVNDIWGSQS